VTHSVVGNFTHDDELNLIVAYVPPASRTHPPPDASTTPDRRRVRKSAAARRSVGAASTSDLWIFLRDALALVSSLV